MFVRDEETYLVSFDKNDKFIKVHVPSLINKNSHNVNF